MKLGINLSLNFFLFPSENMPIFTSISPMPTKPEPPLPPDPSECCGSGCRPCILEIYEDDLTKYQCQLKKWHEQQQQTTRVAQSSLSTHQAEN